MKQGMLFVALVLMLSYAQSQDLNYNNLSQEYRNLAIQAFSKVSPATKKWFADMSLQHTDPNFNLAWTKEKLAARFAVNDMDQFGDLFALMMAYQRIVNKEAREDKKLARQDQKVELTTKASKLEMDNAKIDQQKKEAAEKADQAMQAANTQMTTGIVSVNAQITSGSQGVNNNAKSANLVKEDSLKGLKQNANLQDKKITQQQSNTSKGVESTKAREDYRDSKKDAIKRLLDQLSELGKKAQL